MMPVKTFGLGVVLLGAMALAIGANAQLRAVSEPSEREISRPAVKVTDERAKIDRPNPYEVARDIVLSRSGKSKSDQQKSLKMPIRARVAPSLKFHQVYTLGKAEERAVYDKLVRTFGPPKSIRGSSHVWDIKNPSAGGKQADVVTIIFKMDGSGRCELIMDRDRGEDGRATWAAPRVQPAKKSSRGKVMASRKPVEQNND